MISYLLFFAFFPPIKVVAVCSLAQITCNPYTYSTSCEKSVYVRLLTCSVGSDDRVNTRIGCQKILRALPNECKPHDERNVFEQCTRCS